MKHTVNVGGDCYGISCYQGKFVVSFLNPAKLQILDMNGTTLKTIDGKNIFKDPWFITCNRSSIYVSDCDMKAITKLNWQGDMIGSYSGIRTPRGMSLSDDGIVFVCDLVREVIQEISGDCGIRKEMMQDLKSPYAICWCEETKKLYYSAKQNDEKYDNFLHTYKLS
jgi:hypothetical protein